MKTEQLDLKTHNFNLRAEKLFSIEDVENGLATEEYANILHETKRVRARYRVHKDIFERYSYYMSHNVFGDEKKKERLQNKINKAKYYMELYEKEIEKWEKKKEDYINNVRK